MVLRCEERRGCVVRSLRGAGARARAHAPSIGSGVFVIAAGACAHDWATKFALSGWALRRSASGVFVGLQPGAQAPRRGVDWATKFALSGWGRRPIAPRTVRVLCGRLRSRLGDKVRPVGMPAVPRSISDHRSARLTTAPEVDRANRINTRTRRARVGAPASRVVGAAARSARGGGARARQDGCRVRGQ
jgi:hypothetical protein